MVYFHLKTHKISVIMQKNTFWHQPKNDKKYLYLGASQNKMKQ